MTSFWNRLETSFPLGGPRRHLQDLLGVNATTDLELARVLRQRRVADRYPCPRLGSSDNCPRVVVTTHDGAIHGVCGNSPTECPDVALEPDDIAFLAVDPVQLCRAIASGLQIHAKVEPVGGVPHAYCVGTFVPEPGVKHVVFFLVRTSPRGYAEALDALRSHQDGKPFAVLTPTDRFLSGDTVRQMNSVGIKVLTLADVVGIRDGHFVCLSDPIRVFAGLGRTPAPSGLSSEVVARALVREGSSPPQWRDLDERGYESLVAAADRYDIFADERTKTVTGRSNDQGPRKATASHFEMIRQAVTARGYFDPTADDKASNQQLFQRARKLFDRKLDKGGWRLFKTIKGGETTVYHFDPDPGVSFAFIFLPPS